MLKNRRRPRSYLQTAAIDGQIREKTVDLTNKGRNYQYVSKSRLKDGSLLGWRGVHKPTFWSQNSEGWKQKTLKDLPGATYCEQAQMFASVFASGQPGVDGSVLIRPVGHGLELVPLKNPK